MLRTYQENLIEKIRGELRKDKKSRICCVAPTGSGKSHLIAFIAENSKEKILILTHRAKLLEQNCSKIKEEVSFYCAGLNEKCLKNRIVLASIQSLAGVENLPDFKIILIDECHLVGTNLSSQYRKLLNLFPEAIVVGFTATPFRLRRSGNVSIIKGNGKEDLRFFNNIIDSLSVNDLIKEGFLAPLTTRVDLSIEQSSFNKDFKLDFDMKQAGEILSQKSASYIDEIKKAFTARPPVRAIAFCCDQKHVEDTYEKLKDFIPCDTLTAETRDRERIFERFNRGETKLLINCQVLTEGFDQPNIDYVLLLRPTESAALYCQMVGRGLRIAEGKKDCVILDFGGNVRRHGAITDIKLDPWSGTVRPPDKTRICPNCFTVTEQNPCHACGTAFEFAGIERKSPDEKLTKKASSLDILEKRDLVFQIAEVVLSEHIKKGSGGKLSTDKTLRVDFKNDFGVNLHSEFLCFNHGGWVRSQAVQKWRLISNDAPPMSVRDGLRKEIKDICEIVVQHKTLPGQKYPKRTLLSIKTRKNEGYNSPNLQALLKAWPESKIL